MAGEGSQALPVSQGPSSPGAAAGSQPQWPSRGSTCNPAAWLSGEQERTAPSSKATSSRGGWGLLRSFLARDRRGHEGREGAWLCRSPTPSLSAQLPLLPQGHWAWLRATPCPRIPTWPRSDRMWRTQTVGDTELLAHPRDPQDRAGCPAGLAGGQAHPSLCPSSPAEHSRREGLEQGGEWPWPARPGRKEAQPP